MFCHSQEELVMLLCNYSYPFTHYCNLVFHLLASWLTTFQNSKINMDILVFTEQLIFSQSSYISWVTIKIAMSRESLIWKGVLMVDC